MSHAYRVVRYLSAQSIRTVCEGSRVRVPVGSCACSSPVHLVAQCGSMLGQQTDCLIGCGMVCEGPGFESRSGHMLFLPK